MPIRNAEQKFRNQDQEPDVTQPSSRIPHLSPPYTPEVEQALTRMQRRDRGVDPLKLFRTFARDLPFAQAMGPLGGFMLSGRERGGAAFDLRSREIVIDRVCALCGCEYEWGVHIASYAAKAQLTEDQVYATVHEDASAPCWSDKDRALIAAVDALHRTGDLDDAAYADLASQFDPTQVIELLALAGWYHAIAYMANGLRVELEDWAPRFPAKRAA